MSNARFDFTMDGSVSVYSVVRRQS